MTQKLPETPDCLKDLVHKTCQAHPPIARICGRTLDVTEQDGLTNRVFRLNAENGVFFLRLPREGSAAGIDRAGEARNIVLAAALGVAPAPLYCDRVSGVLLTREVETAAVPSLDFASRLGAAVGKLHASGVSFSGKLDPVEVFSSLHAGLPLKHEFSPELQRLDRIMARMPPLKTGNLVPSHCDLSPGNCLMAREQLWLIDWEYSAMTVPAWDLAYAILENGFAAPQELQFLNAYCSAGAAHLRPGPEDLDIMKTACDAVSAVWALSQVAAGREPEGFHSFARSRLERAFIPKSGDL